MQDAPKRFVRLLSLVLFAAVFLLCFMPGRAMAAPGDPAYLDVKATPSGDVHLTVNGNDWGWNSVHSAIVTEGDTIRLEAQGPQSSTFQG